MSIWQRFKRWRLSHTINEADAPADDTTAMTRATGGNPDHGTPTTTGTGTNAEFVGRVAGDDTDAEETGAERRAEHRAHPADG
ncbi:MULTISPECIES: hypothetical protein [Kribbella]|jgi:hypothetical protein|uniref:Uncharacterized protein n=1 Tax=Kribbella pratensis TaxID=2512112 RepID=A0ABY2FJ40_9ACTN|nr:MULTISPECIES: hypothetical protein [Kribbella]TDW92260.1 hypothetical protein EV647_4096 [Kribbella sp. VKM Ac-2566]TDW92797.1 hypothetical protein EV137_0057 [Kribbella pratensis]